MTFPPEQTPIEEILSSRGRVRILAILSKTGELNISEIARRSGLSYATANKHLQTLRDAGVLEEKRYGRVRIFGLSDSLRAESIKRLVDSWEEAATAPAISR